MTGSMYAAIAGLQTHMQKMNVIGNNIANANTYGFKPGVTSFTESMYTSSKASTAGGAQYGGTNAAQIGYGSKIGSIDLNFAQGTYAATGTNSHLYLDGNGFFLVGPKPSNIQGINDDGTTEEITGYYEPDPDNLTLTRVGNFWLDGDGYLVTPDGNCVYGFMPQGTDQITEGAGSNIMTDAEGNVVWNTCLQPIRLPLAAPKGDGTGIKENGAMYPVLDDQGATNQLEYPQNGGEDVNINKTVPASAVNLSVGQNGVITAVIDGGDPITVGVIAVGSVINPNGLTKLSNGYYQGGNNAGDMTVGTCTGVLGDAYLNNMPADTATSDLAIGKGGTTKIIAGGLESSKTDIAVEFADLITAQRGFQANTKIITVTDEMLSDLVSMKR
ncbi:flagellar hook-basal body complex protein [Agathobaculum sp. NSJ-28]|uniref:Flagellar hook-basal body complex protein n=2 Tax=Agathobaculum TaxID=2048137 RepID=A0A923LW95_9FIRM|nr:MULTISPECIES: flagellar hook-basal body complex protein [Butyricicoccaceae]MBS6883429.1 flagellar hook-basal body complex protein [Clostridiaceae bacterium]SCJ35263.1 Flagellar hook protein flgE [uncultured Butyricicoccus sp.]MBC5725089.1 flagellar hook-basal body complex protein [Agathobaculum faecis]MCU6789742.1 flagellar hook-basal body complex protein [Agathobaculum ammoniilyticum]WOC74533.1 flagellar hook-basal body complex protein [Intestinibacillus sp. NTUH-41-i26]